MKKIAVLGSTGSIGVNALRVIRANPDKYKVVGLAAGRNIQLLLKQIGEFHPLAVCIREEAVARELKDKVMTSKGPRIFFGTQGFIRVATMGEADTVISAMSGAAGLWPTHEAIKAGKHVALANKETIVMAGPLVMATAKQHGISILPIDSEHSAVLQSLLGHPREDLRRVILTASGGPFKDLSLEEMRTVTPQQALNHPNWDMGPKISIDSATMMNKGLEAIEARWLFDLDMDQITILIHTQSVIHSMVEYRDGAVIAQLGVPDMTIPISYALSFPRHIENPLPSLDLDQIGRLDFEKPDLERFRCLSLALEAARVGESMPAVLNAANEVAVEAFLQGRTGFLGIPEVIERTMETHDPRPIDHIQRVMEADAWAREIAHRILQKPPFG